MRIGKMADKAYHNKNVLKIIIKNLLVNIIKNLLTSPICLLHQLKVDLKFNLIKVVKSNQNVKIKADLIKISMLFNAKNFTYIWRGWKKLRNASG